MQKKGNRAGWGSIKLVLSIVGLMSTAFALEACDGQDTPPDSVRNVERNLGTSPADWTELGPVPSVGNDSVRLFEDSGGPQLNAVTGAIHEVLPHPTNADILYVGTVNGGVWKTENALSSYPDWEAQTDFEESLSISAMAMDAGDPERVIAATGGVSSFGGVSGLRGAIYLTPDGGGVWERIDSPTNDTITGIDISGDRILITTLGGRVFRTTDAGTTPWATVATGLPANRPIYDLISTDNPGEFYATVGGEGVYFVDNDGQNWVNISSSDTSTNGVHAAITAAAVSNAELALTGNGRLYVGVVNDGKVTTVGYTPDQGASWITMPPPIWPFSSTTPVFNVVSATGSTPIEVTVDADTGFSGDPFALSRRLILVQISGVTGNPEANGVFIAVPDPNDGTKFTLRNMLSNADVTGSSDSNANTGTAQRVLGISPVGQGGIHFAIEAHPSNENLVYIAGDGGMPLISATGVFRGNATPGAATPWRNIAGLSGVFPGGGTSTNTTPHADSRDLAFDAEGSLLHVSDGGVTKRLLPNSATGDWVSRNGNIGVFEFHDATFDPLALTAMAGAQDNGTSIQAFGTTRWGQILGADGGDVQLRTFGAGTRRYYSAQDLGAFRRTDFNSLGFEIAGTTVQMPVLYDRVCAGFQGCSVDTDCAADGSIACVDQACNAVACSNDADCGNDAGGNPISCNSRSLFDVDARQFVTHFELNSEQPGVFAVAGRSGVFVSTDDGDTVSRINPPIGWVQEIEYGHPNNDEAMWVVASSTGTGIYNRFAAGEDLSMLSVGVNLWAPDVVVDPNDENVAYVVDGAQRVYRATENGASDTLDNITGDLLQQVPTPYAIRSIAYIPSPSGDLLYVASATGVFVSPVSNLGVWTRVGETLPHALAFDLHYSEFGDHLVLATMGRGAWRFSGASEINRPPVAVCQPVERDADAMCLAYADPEDFDNGSSDPDGDPITFSVDPSEPYGLGLQNVTLTVSDDQGAAASCVTTIEVFDVTPPVFDPVENVSLTLCDARDQGVLIVFPTATDNCQTPPTIWGTIISSTNPDLTVPFTFFTPPTVALGIGVHQVQWTASDGPNQTQIVQTYTISAGIYATNSIDLRDQSSVVLPNGTLASVINSGSGFTQVGIEARVGDILSQASVDVRDRAQISGFIRSGGSVSIGNQVLPPPVYVAEFQTINFPPIFAMDGTFSVGTEDYDIQPDGFLSLDPGAYGRVRIASRSELQFSTGQYFLRELVLEPQVLWRIGQNSGPVVVNVRDGMHLHQQAQLVGSSPNPEDFILAYFGTSDVVFETSFNGIIVAPNARVSLGSGNQLSYSGQLYVKNLEIRPNVTFVCLGD